MPVVDWRESLDTMVRERRSALIAYACLFVADRRDAEDLVHDAIVRTFARRRGVPDVASAEGYVRQAIRTAFLDQARAHRTWRRRMHLLAGPVSSPAAEDAASAAADLRAGLAALPPRERACVVLRYVDDLPVRDIATSLGIGEGSVKRYLHDGTRTLRDRLGLVVPDPGTTETVHVTDPGRTR
jgi:RNA polymerase sigma factor (sigma-70 family)